MPIVMTTDNPLDAAAWQRHEVQHVGQFLYEHFNGHWPPTAKLYNGTIAKDHDVTPIDESTTEALEELDGPVWCVVYPATGVEVAIGIGVVALIAAVAAVLLIPEVPNIKTPKDRSDGLDGSPNNSLSRRNNQPRPDQRIPFIVGTVKSIPDSIMVPYITYVDHIEQEIGYYCVGEGDHEVTTELVRDGDTRIDQIQDASAHFYGPGDAPTGTGPFSGTILAIGPAIEDPVLNVYQVTAVNGQSMEPFNSRTIYGAAKFKDVDGSYTNSAGAVDYQNFFTPMAITYVNSTTGILHLPFLKNDSYVYDRVSIGDKIFLFAQTYLASSAPAPNLQTSTTEPFDNAVTITAMATDGVFNRVNATFSVPAALSAQWALVPAYIAGLTLPQSVVGGFDCPFFEATPLTNLYVGPFFVDFEHDPGATGQSVICNFVAPNGMYADDGVVIQKLDPVMAIEVAPADVTGTLTGPWEVKNDASTVLHGSDVTDGQRAVTVRFTPTFSGRFQIRARRATNRHRRHELPTFVEAVNYPNALASPPGQRAYTGRITDEIRWTHCYSVSEPPNISFGNVTTVHTKTIATAGATRLRQRELNALVTRKIFTWNGTTFAGPAVANGDAENILFTIMKDGQIGNRPDSEIDFAGIANACEAVRDYFNDTNTGTLATLVSYTFDDFNTSFEEMLLAVANVAFLTMYRQGNVLKAKPEIESDTGVAAFNHRNIQPGTQKITDTFGPPTENDCVEVDYFDPFDDAITHIRFPLFGSFSSPRNLRLVGLRTRRQAYWHAARAYQKMQYQRQSLEMKTTQEGGLVIQKDRILVADLTSASRQSGHVVEVSGLNLRLSQPPAMPGPGAYTIFFQHTDGTVEGIPVVAGAGAFDVTLGAAPSTALVTNSAAGVPTIYTIVKDDESMPYAFLVSEQSAENNMSFNISGINYSHLYYLYDGMSLWVQRQVRDEGPYEHLLDVDHAFGTTSTARGTMIVADGANEFTVQVGPGHSDIIAINGDYSAAAWLLHNSDTGQTNIVATSDDVTRLFGFFDNDLVAGHNIGSYAVQAPCPTGTIVHVGVTYRVSDGRLAIFINGVLVDVALGVATPSTPLALSYFRIFDGQFDNLMVWKRHLSDRAMMELCIKTKI